MRELLGFGKRGDAKIKYIINEDGDIYIGEVNADDEANGRGIHFFINGYFRMGRNKDGDAGAGHFIYIDKSGWFRVGEKYTDANGKTKEKGTLYDEDGNTNEYDTGDY